MSCYIVHKDIVVHQTGGYTGCTSRSCLDPTCKIMSKTLIPVLQTNSDADKVPVLSQWNKVSTMFKSGPVSTTHGISMHFLASLNLFLDICKVFT